MTDLLWELYPVFLDCGYTPSLFWESSLGDIKELIESKRRREKAEYERQTEELKARAVMNRVLARQVAEYIALSMSGNENVKPTALHEYFPELFKENEADRKQETENQMMLYKAKMEEYAFWHNLRRKGADEQ